MTTRINNEEQNLKNTKNTFVNTEQENEEDQITYVTITNSNGMEQQIAAKKLGNYILIKQKLGTGSYAEVFRGFRKKDKTLVAIKVIQRNKLNDKLMSALEYEIAILRKLNHENIVKLYDVHRSKRHYYLVMEFCSGGDLSSFIKTKAGPLQEHIARKFFYDLVSGLKALVDCNLVHRDLKPQNLLLTAKDENTASLKIADFGFAREIKENELAETLCGSPLYMAPEILFGKKYDYKADLWSVGAILFEMVTGKPPYIAQNILQLTKLIKEKAVVIPSSLSREVQFLLQGLLQRDPEKRMNFETLYSSEFIEIERTRRTFVEPKRSSSEISIPMESPKVIPSSNESSPSQQSAPISIPASSRGVDSSKRDSLEYSPISDIITPSSESPRFSKAPISKFKPFKDGDQSYVIVNPSEAMAPLQESSFNAVSSSLANMVRMSPTGFVIFPITIFDFTTLDSHASHDKNIQIYEKNAEKAWALAEAAFLNERYNQSIESLALYNRSMELLYSTTKQAEAEPSTSARLQALIMWMKQRYMEFTFRSEKLADTVKTKMYEDKNSTMQVIRVEQVLYTYALQLAKDALMMENNAFGSITNMKQNMVAMYSRSKLILEYLLENCSDTIQYRQDRDVLLTYIQQIQLAITDLISNEEQQQ